MGYCGWCGAPAPEGSQACASCGQGLSLGAEQPSQAPPAPQPEGAGQPQSVGPVSISPGPSNAALATWALKQSVSIGAATLGATFALSLLLSAFLQSLGQTALSSGQVLMGASWITDIAFSAPLTFSAAASGLGRASGAVYVPVTLLFVVAATLAFVLGRRSRMRFPLANAKEELTWAAVSGITAAVVAVLLAGLSRGGPGLLSEHLPGGVQSLPGMSLLSSSSFSVGAGPALSFLSAGAVTFAAVFLGRIDPARLGAKGLSAWWRASKLVLVAWGIGILIVGAVELLYPLHDISVRQHLPQFLGSFLLFFPTLAFTGWLAALGVSITAGAASSRGSNVHHAVGYFATTHYPILYLGIAIAIVAAAVSVVRDSLQSPRGTAVDAGLAGRSAAVGAVISVLAAYLASGSADVSAYVSSSSLFFSGSSGQLWGSAGFGPSLFGALFAGAIWGAVLGAAGVFVTPFLASIAPGALRRIGVAFHGRLHPDWEAALAGSTVGARFEGASQGGARAPVVPPGAWPGGVGGEQSRVAGMGQPAPIAPMSRKKKLSIGLVLAVLVLGTAGFVTVRELQRSAFGPAAAARRVLDGIAAGNPAALGAASASANDPLLSATAIGVAQRNAPVRIGKAMSTSPLGGGLYQVGYQMQVGRQSRPGILEMQRSGTRFLVFPRWVVKNAVLPRLAVGREPQGVTVRINGIAVKAGRTYPVMPGGYRVQYRYSPYFYAATGTSQWSVGLGSYQQIGTQWHLSNAGKAAAYGAVTSAYNACLASTSLTPPNCPFSDSVSYQGISAVSWQSQQPILSSASISINSSDTGAYVQGNYDVTANYNYNDPTFGPGSSSDPFFGSYNADVHFNGSQASVVSWN